MRRLLIAGLGILALPLLAAATPAPPVPKPVILQIEKPRYNFIDSVKQYLTVKTPVLGAADLSKRALDTLNFKDVTLPARLRARHLVWQQTPRRWAVSANRYFTGRVPVTSTMQPIATQH